MYGHETGQFGMNLNYMLVSRTPGIDCPVALGWYAELLFYVALLNSILHRGAVILAFGFI